MTWDQRVDGEPVAMTWQDYAITKTLTFAVARDLPVGAVIAAWSGKLSRMYRWDLEHDVFTPGQFVKARAQVLAISPDGKYVAYYGESHHKRAQSYVAVAHVPYFTAHVFLKQFHLAWRAAQFVSNQSLKLMVRPTRHPWVKGYHLVKERIDPGGPLRIVRYTLEDLDSKGAEFVDRNLSIATDKARKRTIVEDHCDLIEMTNHGKNRRVITSFPRELFKEVATPDWAQQW